MGTVTIARTRCALALVAGAALLGLSACGPDAGDDNPEDSSAAPSASSDGGGAQESETDAGGDQASDGGGAATGGDQEGEEGSDAAGDRTQIMLRLELGLDDSTGEGALVLPPDQLAALLAGPLGGRAECDGELVLAPDAAPVECLGPESIDRTEPTQEWVANVVMVPSESDLQDGSTVAVLFSTGTELPEEADDLLDEDVVLTGLGFGSTFGREPLSADDLAGGTLDTLTSDNAYVPVDRMADWDSVTCEDGMDFSRFETVDCEATTAEGTTWDLEVAPGTFMDNDQGLLVGIRRTSVD